MENCLVMFGVVGIFLFVLGFLWIVYIKFCFDYVVIFERVMWDCMLGRFMKMWNFGFDVVD